ncbi:MAG: fluoride efflux transporter CrcB [Pyrinomonadaceae bacterium]|nr:fluoride efflux transporter CrcB [Pyrinomonadaceae bacterium]MCX7639648.1 fluoride efflux transporter CrcB [Pyrinomonadaceae bacterium]MDW8303334.1 fluoride efflux transporter CrcB [Acidobacteriota bacterium]
MYRLLLVGLGGFVGSCFRYLMSGWVQNLVGSISFPFGTLIVNLLGCFLIGFLSYLAEERGVFTTEARVLVFVGFLGGFTTYSTFSNESINMIRGAEYHYAFLNIATHLTFGLLLVWAGRSLAYLIWR